ncbi:MAG: PocR ligand-binding domain-containing protein [Methanosarcinales archaeon]|nr:PocR ligand-binding domain-containing protein [Methanosarcinales archaeon]
MNYKIFEIINKDKIQYLTDSFCEAIGVSSAIIDLNGTILIASGWQKICTDFHRVNPQSYLKCKKNETILANKLLEGQKYAIHQCQNGLIDTAAPIMIEGEHIANFFVGQYLFEPPDIEYFRKQVHDYGFDETSYIKALSKVPVISKERIKPILDFLTRYAEFIGEMGLKQIRQLEATNALVESEIKYRTLYNSSKDAIMILSPGERYLGGNVAAIKMFGCKSEGEFISKNPADLSPVYQPDGTLSSVKAHQNMAIAMENGSYMFEWKHQRMDGVEFFTIVLLNRIELQNKKLLQATVRDITESKKAEAILEQALTDLKRSNKDLGQFAYVVSHDLQEPLRMVSSYVQLLERRYKGKLDPDADDFIGYAVDGANRMQTLIEDLLTYSRVGTRGKPFKPTDCEDILEKVLANLKLAIEDNNATVTYDSLPTVIADASQLVQLLQNLIGNAIKFSGDNPLHVNISAKQKSDKWKFSVADNGIGIEPEFFERIFIIFQRLHSREEYIGTGIGLAVCKKIVERHDGEIWVESEPGEGTTFCFTIPIKRDEQE